jgi:hypothetical protein
MVPSRRSARRTRLVALIALLTALAAAPGASAGDTTCVGGLTGTHENVIVPSGADCVLTGADVRGNVKILSEGSLRAVAAGTTATRIGGNVQGDDVEFALLQFQTRVEGDFQIKGSNPGTTTGHDIGTFVGGDTQLVENDGDLFVDAASIREELEIKKNTGRLEIEFNTVGGGIKIEENEVPSAGMSVLGNRAPTGNLGVFKNTGPGAKNVVNNTIGQNLQCKENELPFVGGPNVAGDAEDQCTAAAPPAVAAPAAAVPGTAAAGTLFSYRVRVATPSGAPVRAGTIGCLAKIGKGLLRPVSKGWRHGAASCTWRLPKAAKGKTVRGSVRVKRGPTRTVVGFSRRVA